jgi:hypothetical protein
MGFPIRISGKIWRQLCELSYWICWSGQLDSNQRPAVPKADYPRFPECPGVTSRCNNLPAVTRPTIFYDNDLTGFGLKASPTGALSYIVEYRPGVGGRSVSKRRMVIGTPKNLTPEEARNQASGILGTDGQSSQWN